MSSDESTGTQISTVSNRDNTKTKLKSHKSEEWEINLIGNFVLGLYHRSIVSANNEWLIKKSLIREEYSKFITKDLRKKLNELNGSSDIGTMLHRCGFLLNTPRGSPFFKIKYSNLFDFRNSKIKELDKLKINSDGLEQITNSVKSPESILLELVDNISNVLQEDNLEVDESIAPIPLEYQASLMQIHNENYNPTNMSCCICEEDFSSMDTYEEHIQKHGDDTDFEFLNTMSKFDNPIFKMTYRLCKNSHYFCFEFETQLENIIIDKIIIVQSRSFYYVHNMRVPYKCPENGKDRFFVDSHLFTIHIEQPIVLICHLESNKETHIVEQHHFMRSEEFPKVNFSINPYRLPDKKIFKPKFQLADYYPPKEIQDALKDDFYYEKLMKTSNEFRDYVRNGKILQPHNIGASINILLQIEDMDNIQQYLQLTQKNIKLRSYGDEYSFQLKPKQRVFIENILSAYDEVILTTRTDILTKSEDIMQLMLQNKSDINRMKNTFVGLIQAVNTGRISFKCDKKINIHGLYTVICRPSRLNFRYQYRSLELLPIAMDFLKKFLFPSKIMPRQLSRISLDLHNKNINEEQLQAVRNIAEGPRNDATYIIFGPPGTGKTTTIVESILQLLKKPNTKILVTASSNSACDEVALRLCKYLKQLDIPRAIVRIYSRSSEIRTETIADDLLENSNMYNGQFYPDVEILHEYRIVVCTLSVLAKLATGKFGRQENGSTLYTHLFIDEVAASMEAEALIAITTVLTPKSCLIISGDHKQLGPILQSKRAKELGLDVSLMDRLLDRDCYRVDVDTGDYDRTIQTRLIRNYRSHPAIVNLYSGLYYNHSLESCAKKDDVSLCELWHKSRNKQYPIIFHAIYDPSRSDYQSHSLYNLRELEVVMDYVKDLMYFGINGKPVQESDIGIISPYKKQYRRIQEELNIRKWFNIETGSVETFQGKEKDIIIVSFVRSGTHNLGFLDNPRRLNVTISRPRSILILVGNPQTLSLNSEFEYIIKECQRNKTFVGGIGPPRAFGGAEVKKEDTKNADDDLLKLLTDNMKALSVEKKNEEKEEQNEKPRKARRRRRFGRNSKNKISNDNNNTTVDDKDDDEDDDEDGEEDEEDNISETSSKPSTSGMKRNDKNKRQLNKRAGAKSGKITKQYGKGKQKPVVDNKSSNSKILEKNKIESLFDELPKVPPTTLNDTTTIVNSKKAFNYTNEQLMHMRQQQQQYFDSMQRQQQLQQQQQLHHWSNSPYSNNNNTFLKIPIGGQYPLAYIPSTSQQQHFNQEPLQYSSPFASTPNTTVVNNANNLRFPNVVNVSNDTTANRNKDNKNNRAAANAANKTNTNNRNSSKNNNNNNRKVNNNNKQKTNGVTKISYNKAKNANAVNATMKSTKIAANIHATTKANSDNANKTNFGAIPKTNLTSNATARPSNSVTSSYTAGAVNPITKTVAPKAASTVTVSTNSGGNKSINSTANIYPTLNKTSAVVATSTSTANRSNSSLTTTSNNSNFNRATSVVSTNSSTVSTFNRPTTSTASNLNTSSYNNHSTSSLTTNIYNSTSYAPSAPPYNPYIYSDKIYNRPTGNLSFDKQKKEKNDNSCVIS
ncbi:hypothetical protein FF38_02178 [Lucilia cuprina]|uniref:C2H2-type domain-containing protein n=1 Tax=Lucilia cuprina TaxID=7375 RepID=A0A0L0BW06_LUCCU|nr:hypothetical protein FF38_02178 [Lucilia cuprina]